MLESAGYPTKDGALAEVSRHLNVPAMTLSRWFRGVQNPPPNRVVNEEKKALHEELRDLAYKIIGAMPSKLEDAGLQQQAVSLGIVVEKMQLLENKPTDRIDHTFTDEERDQRLAQIFDTARTRRNGRAPEHVQ